MFKKILLGFTIIIIIFVGFIAFRLSNTKSHSPEGQTTFSNKDVTISVYYHRPFKKNRKIFGGLVPYGKYWRTGANDATEIEFSQDVMFGTEKVKAGRYRVYTIPDENKWTVVLNSELGKWGLFEPNYDLDVLRVEVNPVSQSEVQEQFEIILNENGNQIDFVLAWDQTKVVVPLSWVDIL